MSAKRRKDVRVYWHTAALLAAANPKIPPAPHYIKRGSTTHFEVWYAEVQAPNGPALADAVLGTCEADYAQLQGWFGNIGIGSLPFVVRIQQGDQGATHFGCTATELFCDAFNGSDLDLVRSLVVAEEDEVFMANQNTGWDCSASNGEALSRVLAAAIYPNELTPAGSGISFATGASWLDSSRPDWVTNPEASDSNPVSIGCGTLFINWLRYQLGFSLDQIIQHGAKTLAETYHNLTGLTDGFQRFSALLAAHFPVGTASHLANDNPFPLASDEHKPFTSEG
jgi:hypothetical protein